MFLNPSFPEIKNKMLETKLALFTQDIDHKSRGVRWSPHWFPRWVDTV